MPAGPFRPIDGLPTYQEEYRGSYVPKVVKTPLGLQVVAPDSPYVAASGTNQLYFIDTRIDPEQAQHIKEQTEAASVPRSGEYTFVDEIEVTAEKRNAATHEATFVFDPAFVRVMFARTINRRNPALKLPEPTATPGSFVTYDLEGILAGKDACSSLQNPLVADSVGACRRPKSSDIVDAPKEDGEKEAS